MGRGPLQAFRDYATRSPSASQRVGFVVLAVVLPLGLWHRRSVEVGIVAAVVYGWIFLVAAFNHSAMLAWERRHVVLDSLLIVPVAFLGLAYLTSLSLWLCIAAAVGAGVVFVPVALWRRGNVAA